jgi:hypothetical protein
MGFPQDDLRCGHHDDPYGRRLSWSAGRRDGSPTGRSLAADRDQIARIDAFAPGFGQSLLRALSRMIEQWATTGHLAMA